MADLTPDAAAELRLLRAEVRALRAHVTSLRGPVPHGWLKHVVKDLETNPRVQYKVHLYGAAYWLVNIPAVILLYLFAPGLWLKLGIFITLLYSIYANFATDYGGMSAAMASFGQAPLPEIPVESHVDFPEGGSSEP
jgi:hypothetical protein